MSANYKIRLALVNKAKLKDFVRAVNHVRPGYVKGTEEERWYNLPRAERQNQIRIFLDSRLFTDDEIKRIAKFTFNPINKAKRYLKEINHRKRSILITALGIVILFIGLKTILFLQHQKIYVAEERISLKLSDSTLLEVDVWKSPSLLMHERMGNKYVVSEHNWFKWVFDLWPGTGLIDTTLVISDKLVFRSYQEFYQGFKGFKSSHDLTLRERKSAFYGFIERFPGEEYKLVAEVPKMNRLNYLPFETVMLDSNKLFFFSAYNGSNYFNGRIVYRNESLLSLNEVIGPGDLHWSANQLLWKRSPAGGVNIFVKNSNSKDSIFFLMLDRGDTTAMYIQ